MISNAVLNVILMRPLGVGGLALATSISSWLNVLILGYVLRRRIGILGIKRILMTFAKTSVAASLMGIVSYLIAFRFLVSMPAAGMILSIIGGIGTFFLASYILKVEEINHFIKAKKER